MKIITPCYILAPNTILRDTSVVFDKTIIDILPKEEALKKYPKAQEVLSPKNSLLIPGLINPHVHLEFSANKNTLEYGSFVPWLYSVIKNREELIESCEYDCVNKAINMMIKNGITTIGAVSSYGLDFQSLKNSPMRTILFNELIGSNPAMADGLFADFQARVNESSKLNKELITPAIAIHSPYSVHPILIKKAISIAKKNNMLLTAHFMESLAEREWIDNSTGEFSGFFKDFLNQTQSVTTSLEFLEYFNNYPTLFTHAIYTNDKEREILRENNHTIIHSPTSNRLLGNDRLEIEKLIENKIPFVLGTDGLSSNYTLDIFEEMKNAIFKHFKGSIHILAKKLFLNSTKEAATALGLNAGEIKKDNLSDMVLLEPDFEIKSLNNLYLDLILQPKNIYKTIINGEIL